MSTNQNTGKVRRAIIIILILLLLLVIYLVGVGLVVHFYGDSQHADEPADAIIVLGAGFRRDGRPGPALIRRARHAAELWHEGVAPKIICTGAFPRGFYLSEAGGCRNILLALDVPSSAIILEERSRSTEENALYSREILEQEGWDTVILVTDSFHALRAQWIFKQQGLEVDVSAVPSEQVVYFSNQVYFIGREVAAIHWQVIKTILNLDITYVYGI